MTLNQHAPEYPLVKQVRADHPRLGGRKLYLLLKPEMDKREIKTGRDAFFDLLSTHKLLIRRRKRRIMTTFSRHRFRKYPNLIKELVIVRPNQVWVSDFASTVALLSPLAVASQIFPALSSKISSI
nr:hypothetical protein [Cesiribacter sp. SM1]